MRSLVAGKGDKEALVADAAPGEFGVIYQAATKKASGSFATSLGLISSKRREQSLAARRMIIDLSVQVEKNGDLMKLPGVAAAAAELRLIAGGSDRKTRHEGDLTIAKIRGAVDAIVSASDAREQRLYQDCMARAKQADSKIVADVGKFAHSAAQPRAGFEAALADAIFPSGSAAAPDSCGKRLGITTDSFNDCIVFGDSDSAKPLVKPAGLHDSMWALAKSVSSAQQLAASRAPADAQSNAAIAKALNASPILQVQRPTSIFLSANSAQFLARMNMLYQTLEKEIRKDDPAAAKGVCAEIAKQFTDQLKVLRATAAALADEHALSSVAPQHKTLLLETAAAWNAVADMLEQPGNPFLQAFEFAKATLAHEQPIDMINAARARMDLPPSYHTPPGI
ncbi:MAG: hypothetical protein V4787_07015 [Pseudomonadota bacterium]